MLIDSPAQKASSANNYVPESGFNKINQNKFVQGEMKQ